MATLSQFIFKLKPRGLMWGVKVRGRSDFKGFACRGVISWKGNNCGRSRVGWAEMELQIWPGLWPKRESLLSGPRLPARYQQLPPEAWLCQETPLLAVERRIIGTEVPFSSLMCFCIYVVHLQCWLNSVNGGRSRDTTLRTFSVSWEWMTSWGGVCVQRLGHSIPLEFRSMRSNQMGGEAPGKVILEPQPEPQIWPGLWPNRESLLSGPRQPARYQQLSPKAGLCQETSLLVVGRQIVGTEVSSSSLISLNPQFSLFLVQAIMISCMGNSLLALVTLTFIPLIKDSNETYLVAQWMGVLLPMQGTRVWSPFGQDFTMPQNNWARAPQLLRLRAATTEAHTYSPCSAARSHRSEKPVHRNEEQPPLTATKESPHKAMKTQCSRR